jgi:hypothetical protein
MKEPKAARKSSADTQAIKDALSGQVRLLQLAVAACVIAVVAAAG